MIRLWAGILLMLFNGMRDTLPLLAAAALHEAGHIFACLLFRVPIRFFRIHTSGAVIGYDTAALPYSAEAWIAAAGPIAGLCGTAAAVLWGNERSAVLFASVSLGLSVFNLLPVPPLDGGVILSALLHQFFRADTCEKILSVFRHAGTVLLWIFSVSVQLRCGGNLSLLIISICMLIRLAE